MLEKKRVFSWKTYVPYAESLRIVILRYLEKFLGFLVFLGQGNSEKTKENKKVEKAKKCYRLPTVNHRVSLERQYPYLSFGTY